MISVALAAYEGEAYIEAQLRSILPQLSHDDEIIVSDDKPGGATERIVRRVMADDPLCATRTTSGCRTRCGR